MTTLGYNIQEITENIIIMTFQLLLILILNELIRRSNKQARVTSGITQDHYECSLSSSTVDQSHVRDLSFDGASSDNFEIRTDGRLVKS